MLDRELFGTLGEFSVESPLWVGASAAEGPQRPGVMTRWTSWLPTLRFTDQTVPIVLSG